MGPDYDKFPPPLPPTKIPRPVTMEPMGQKFQCCECRGKEGVLTCTRCKAVRYCDKTCQKKQWPVHKRMCATIKETFEETERAANIMKHFHESPNSKKVDLFERYFNGVQTYQRARQQVDTYERARQRLICALEICGDECGSELASDLAAGNLQDMMMFKYKEYWAFEGVREELVGHLINANLDQEAYDYLRYFYIREESQEALPYLSIEPQDIEASLSQAEIDKLRNLDIIVFALLKYKRMRHIQFQKLCETIRFDFFLMGTHPRPGENSAVMKIRGISVIIDTLSNYIFKPLKNRVHKLHKDIEILLHEANKNQYVIPGILDGQSLPRIGVRYRLLNDQGEIDHRQRPVWERGENEGELTADQIVEDSKVRDAHVTLEVAVRAWIAAIIGDEGFLERFLTEGRLPKPSEMPRLELIASQKFYWKRGQL